MAHSTAYPHLFQPVRVGPVTLPNRLIMGSMHTGMEEAADGADRLAAFYAERARGGAALIVTGGYSPNPDGRLDPRGHGGLTAEEVSAHRRVTDAVHDAGGRILLQMLHAGRYAPHKGCVAPSAVKAPINPFTPRAMDEADIARTLDDFAAMALRAREAGYDGVEIMGSEGYLLNEFVAPRTNHRTDAWGGPLENRIRFPVEVVRRVRAAVGADFLIMFRISALDLVDGGSPFEEVAVLARAVEAAGADVLNTGIGWHEARIPTIAYMVPRAAWRWATARLKDVAGIPVIASNRFNTPDDAEAAIAEGGCDLVSMARPFLADPDFVAKAQAGRGDRINTCIACNQGCLDFIFTGREATCLVNPRAGREGQYAAAPVTARKRIAVVGGGPAGMACAAEAAARGHAVTLFDAKPTLGGQFDLARRIPGKADYAETIRYFTGRLAELGVEVRVDHRATADDLRGYDEVVLATGIAPRRPAIPGIERDEVVSYLDILTGARTAGERVAIIGAGGIGFDVATYLLGEEAFEAHWGITRDPNVPGGVTPAPQRAVKREITMLQRKASKPGAGLGKTTGWVHRLTLEQAGVAMMSAVEYQRIDGEGVHVSVDGAPRVIPADTVVVCAGQEPLRDLLEPLQALGVSVHLIGGADVAAELDARRAIDQGTRVGLSL
ncbi:NADPH-dependent 2,4-dienoyl-CoA reductase [Azospirillum sp.]|uniref:NADPH-dependent 2,4-dienoyl-CoA reductase n=1 Tax=Azospirillum sp. TaxID=34012 RepID=UPI002D7093B4|nr:NADPH-dependent 2,4-dienoyl-CoA reductase [Azospirillum sp.]HYD69805.1 NADPH-dependent 2,4-dienoyl-CoA reductase [Azospirillum sp.]